MWDLTSDPQFRFNIILTWKQQLEILNITNNIKTKNFILCVVLFSWIMNGPTKEHQTV